MYIISAFFAVVCKKNKIKSELLVNFWSTYSVGDFGWDASDGRVIGQESSEGSSLEGKISSSSKSLILFFKFPIS